MCHTILRSAAYNVALDQHARALVLTVFHGRL